MAISTTLSVIKSKVCRGESVVDTRKRDRRWRRYEGRKKRQGLKERHARRQSFTVFNLRKHRRKEERHHYCSVACAFESVHAFIVCALSVHCLCIVCALSVHCLCVVCALSVRCLCGVCAFSLRSFCIV